MAATKNLIVPAAVRNEIAALKRRVVSLERQLLRGRPERPEGTLKAFERDMDDGKARWSAGHDYWQAKRDAQLLADPVALAIARKAEREFNDFLKARGIKPLPSHLPRRALARKS